MDITLITFSLAVIAIVGLFFILSYLWWSDRHKSPEVIGAELQLYSEKIGGMVSVLGAALVAFAIIYPLANLFLQIR